VANWVGGGERRLSENCHGSLLAIFLFAFGALCSACSSSPTGPSLFPTITVTGTVDLAVGSTSQLAAKATLSNGTIQDVPRRRRGRHQTRQSPR
jgi:hypothetical protein